jgi:hypothetical protein
VATQAIPQPQRRKGFTPFPNDVLLDWPRLASGDSQVFTLMYLNSETTGAARAPKTAPPYWSRPITTEELAAFARCSVRAVQLAVEDLAGRKVIERKRASGGAWLYHIPFDKWPRLPDRPPKVVLISGDAEDAEEDTDPDASSTKGQVIPVFDKPQRVRAGARPRPRELPAAAGKLRLTSSSEIEYTASLCDGLLMVDLRVPEGETKANTKRNKFRFDPGKSKKTQETALALAGGESFGVFVGMASSAGLYLPDTDSVELRRMQKFWAALTAADQTACLTGIAKRVDAGEFDDPTFRPFALNYLTKRKWLQPIRAAASKAARKSAEIRRQAQRLDEILGGL